MLPCGFVCLGSFNALFWLLWGLCRASCCKSSTAYGGGAWLSGCFCALVSAPLRAWNPFHGVFPWWRFLLPVWGLYGLCSISSSGSAVAVLPMSRGCGGSVVFGTFPRSVYGIGTGTACTFSPVGRLVRRACWG